MSLWCQRCDEDVDCLFNDVCPKCYKRFNMFSMWTLIRDGNLDNELLVSLKEVEGCIVILAENIIRPPTNSGKRFVINVHEDYEAKYSRHDSDAGL